MSVTHWLPPVDDAVAWLALLAAAACTGLAKGGLGGFGFVPIVVLASVFPARLSTGVLLLQLISADLIAVRLFNQHAQWSVIRRILPPALVGIVAGWMLMGRVPDAVFRPLLGQIILVLSILQILRPKLGSWIERTSHSQAFVWTMGGAGGVTTMLANAAGPVMALYFLAVRLPRMEFVGTAAWFFFVVNIVKVPFSIGLGLMPVWSVTLAAVVLPAILGGVLAGRWVVKRLPQNVFELLVLTFAIFGGLKLLFS